MSAEAEEGEHPEPEEEPEEPDTPEEESPEEPSEDETEEDESEDEEVEVEEPDVYDFTEDSGYTAEDLAPAYGEIAGDDYILDEESENVLIGDSSWNEIEGLLSEEESSESLNERAKRYLLDNDKEYAAAGAAGMGSGLLAGGLGYWTAADILFLGGAASVTWAGASYLGKKAKDYLSDEDSEPEPEEDTAEEIPDHELSEYSDWSVEIVDEEAYNEAIQEYHEEH